MKKAIFVDRDGTLIKEPPVTYQIDSLEKLEFLPGVIRNLYKISNDLGHDLIMVTNQDGLGTPSFPENTFWPVHEKMMKILENEGVCFKNVHIDGSLPADNKDTRKPGIGMLKEYINGEYDMENSFVIGDRYSDVLLSQNLKCGSIFLKSNPHDKTSVEDMGMIENNADYMSDNWDDIYKYIKKGHDRTATIERKTSETSISLSINLDGSGASEIKTGLGFLDHMVEQIAKHSMCDILLKAQGDLYVDEHHVVEDVAICLGESFSDALGDKRGTSRYGFVLPMDESQAKVVLDFSGRSWLSFEADFKREKVGDVPTELFFHFFRTFVDSCRCTLHIEANGSNEHHKIEAIFKAFGKSIKMAVEKSMGNYQVPSTKGML
ncbi:MAG: bifunctional histidinol-phosphatase/imidazoleglycerol-phosphate dehydratase HisB [Bacteriovoracaceae bacterium]|nr:bifunctional histidinol-phosphatase/imidazoleglycerol-phosphate dehydratase HisB [Bacteriovoracaceae bacterium]